MTAPSGGSPTWFPDELHHAGRENLDADHVSRYDAKEDAGGGNEVALSRSCRPGS